MMKKALLSLLSFLFLLGFVHAQTADGSGTGFFINNDGVIVTCAHVIEDASRVTVLVNDKEYPAEILAANSETDVAILKIDYRNPRHFKIANFNTVNLADRLSVLGFPLSNILGSDIRFTEGSVSARNGIKSDPISFQHSAPTQPGNSGGPILNSRLEVIGIAAAVINDDLVKRDAGSIPQNINFGVKSDYIQPLLNNIRAGNGNIRNVTDAVNATVMILSYSDSQDKTIEITVENRTGYLGMYLYVSPVSSTRWGPDRLEDDVLPNGRSITIRVPLSENNRYDLRLLDSDEDSYEKRDILIMPNQTVIFTFDDFYIESDPVEYDGPPVTIVNNTGYTVYYVYISPTSDDNWGRDRLNPDQVLNNGQSVTLRLPQPLDVNNKYDIMLKDVDGDTYSRFNVTLTENQRIVFTFSDID